VEKMSHFIDASAAFGYKKFVSMLQSPALCIEHGSLLRCVDNCMNAVIIYCFTHFRYSLRPNVVLQGC
jgi:hypothetical protein